MEPPSKDTRLQRLRIGKSLGAGAFAVVHQGTYDGQQVAVKVLLPHRGPSTREDCPVKMFIREGQLLQRLEHSHIVRCLVVLELPPDFPGLVRGYVRPTWALVLELLEGGSLCSLLHKQLLAPWKFMYDNATALAWSTQIASALAHLHGLSPPVIHRDVKTDNVMFKQPCKGGQVEASLIDLGLHSRPLTLERNTRRTLLRAPQSAGSSSRSLLGTSPGGCPGAGTAGRGAGDAGENVPAGRTVSLPCGIRPPSGITQALQTSGMRGDEAELGGLVRSRPASVRSIFFEVQEDGSALFPMEVCGPVGAQRRGMSAPAGPPRLLSLCVPPQQTAPVPVPAPAPSTPPVLPSTPQVQVELQPHPPVLQSQPTPHLQLPPQSQTTPPPPRPPVARVGSRGVSDTTGSFALVLGVPPPPPKQEAQRNRLPPLPPALLKGDSSAGPAAAATASALADRPRSTASTATCAMSGTTSSSSTTATAISLAESTLMSSLTDSDAWAPMASKRPSIGGSAAMATGAAATAAAAADAALTTGAAADRSVPADAAAAAGQESAPPQGARTDHTGGAQSTCPAAPPIPATPMQRMCSSGLDDSNSAAPASGAATSSALMTAAPASCRPTSASVAAAKVDKQARVSRLAVQLGLQQTGGGSAAAAAGAVAIASGGKASSCSDQPRPPSRLDSSELGASLGMEVVYCLTGETGSCMTMAPEIKLMQPYNEKIDVYAFGVVLYEIWSRSLLAVSYIGTRRPDLPYMVHRVTDWPELAASGFRPARVDAIPGPVWELITQCWDQDPLARPAMAEVEQRLRRMAEPDQSEAVIGLASGKGGRRLDAARAGSSAVGKSKTEDREGGPAVPSCGCTIC